MSWQNFKWVVENAVNILILILASFFIIGSLFELVARFIPTKTPDAFITRIGLKMGNFGKSLVMIGTGITKFLDYIRVPNRLK
jgi:hypothetical protein